MDASFLSALPTQRLRAEQHGWAVQLPSLMKVEAAQGHNRDDGPSRADLETLSIKAVQYARYLQVDKYRADQRCGF